MNEYVSKARVARNMYARPEGATMREIIAATGGPHYNELKRLGAQGYFVRKVKEGNETRYFASAPSAAPSYEATVTAKGQVTIPRAVRENLGVRPGGKVKFSIGEDNRVVVSKPGSSIQDLFGILGKPPRSATLEEMDAAIRQGAVDRFLRAVGRKR